jgi:L-iditol 2-dehydrogenase
MKALVLESYNVLSVKEVPDPVPASDEVLVEVRACGICGSDVHGMDGSTGRRQPPIIMGHEASGVIVQTGEHVHDWKAGDRVTFDSTIYPLNDWYTRRGQYNLSDGRQVLGVSCNEFRRDGAYARYVVVPQHILYRIPDNVSFTQAAMVEPAAVALHAINLTPLFSHDVAIVMGAGMVGMFVIQLLKLKGCQTVIAIDPEQDRLDKALQCGADLALTPADPELQTKLLQLTSNRGADIAMEVVGVSETIQHCISLLRKGGNLTLIGNLSPRVEMPLQAIVTRQLRVQGSCAINGEYSEILELISSGALNVNIILSAEAPLEEGPQWFSRLYNKEKGLMKVVLTPS